MTVLEHLKRVSSVKNVEKGLGASEKKNKKGHVIQNATASRKQLMDAIVHAKAEDAKRDRPSGPLLIKAEILPKDSNDTSFSWEDLKKGLIQLLTRPNKNQRQRLNAKVRVLKRNEQRKTLKHKGSV